MKHFLLVATVVMISEKNFFSFSMAAFVKETNSFFKIMQLINKNYSWKMESWKNEIKNTQEKLS